MCANRIFELVLTEHISTKQLEACKLCKQCKYIIHAQLSTENRENYKISSIDVNGRQVGHFSIVEQIFVRKMHLILFVAFTLSSRLQK